MTTRFPGPYVTCELRDGCTCAPMEMRGCVHAYTVTPGRIYTPEPSPRYLRPRWRDRLAAWALLALIVTLAGALAYGFAVLNAHILASVSNG